ncbi:MAG: hypothetical protein ACXWDM_06285 [Nocardioides sp.]
MSGPVVVLVEGGSDVAALAALPAADGLRERFEPVAMGGITNVSTYVERLRRERPDVVLLGVCDERERRYMERERPALADVFVCERDLEDELIRAVGPEAVVGLLDELGELGRFRTFQEQPEWRGQPLHDQLRRFAGTRSGRKAVFAGRLAAELTTEDVPAPLARLLERVRAEVSP